MKTFFMMCALLLALPSGLDARSFTEQTVKCRSLTVYRDDNNTPHAQATCESFDSTGRSLLVFDVDVFPDLTAQQKSQLGAIADLVHTIVRSKFAIPSPTPTSTP